MKRLIKTILIISIFLPFASAQAQVDNLVVEFQQTPLFKEANFLPGEGVSHWVKVTNNSGQTQRIATQPLNITDPNHLGDVLNLVIKEGGTTLYSKPFSTFFNAGEEFLSNLANGANTQYDFTVSFYSGTQNTFQGKSLGFDILIGFQGTEGGILPGAGSSSGVSGGGWLPPGLTIQNEATATTTETSATFIWATSYPASSQVIYAKDGESHTLCLTQTEGCAIGTPPPPKYGYAHTTPESDISPKVTSHLVTIGGLTPGTKYYYRTVSHASLAIGEEHNFTTLNVLSNAPSVSVAITPPSMSVPAEKSTAETPAVPAEQPVAQTTTQNSLAATIGGFLTLGTRSVWLGILVGLIILAIIVYVIYLLRKRKNSGNI